MKRYDVEINGTKTTLLLSDADAEAAGLTPVADKATVTTKAKTPANKARKTANKRAEIAAQAFTAKPESDDDE